MMTLTVKTCISCILMEQLHWVQDVEWRWGVPHCFVFVGSCCSSWEKLRIEIRPPNFHLCIVSYLTTARHFCMIFTQQSYAACLQQSFERVGSFTGRLPNRQTSILHFSSLLIVHWRLGFTWTKHQRNTAFQSWEAGLFHHEKAKLLEAVPRWSTEVRTVSVSGGRCKGCTMMYLLVTSY